VGTYNSTGKQYHGHFDIWLTNKLQQFTLLNEDLFSESHLITNWVNGNYYVQTDEVFGILPIPSEVQQETGMQAFNPSLDSKQTHHFLASMQGTRKAVLPVHTLDEYQLFNKFMVHHDSNWTGLAQSWNREAEVKSTIYYKVTQFSPWL
jgi:hypothetical protein